MSDCLPHLLDDDEVAHLLGYRNTTAFRRRRKRLEAEGFPERRPIVKRYSPMEVREWIDGKNGLQSGSDPLLQVAGKWGASLAVPIRKLPDGGPDWEQTAADMLAAITGLTDPADTGTSGRFKRDNRDTLEQMRQADRSAWSAVEHQLADRDRELREQRNE